MNERESLLDFTTTINKRTVLIGLGLLVMVVGAAAYLGFMAPDPKVAAEYGSRYAAQERGGAGAVAFFIGLGLLVWGLRTALLPTEEIRQTSAPNYRSPSATPSTEGTSVSPHWQVAVGEHE